MIPVYAREIKIPLNVNFSSIKRILSILLNVISNNIEYKYIYIDAFNFILLYVFLYIINIHIPNIFNI